MKDRVLLFSITKKDFEITYFSGTGAGGQYRNRHKNCIRIKHKETGLIGIGQSERSQKQNLRDAFKALTNNKEFKKWLKIKTSEVNGDRIRMEEEVKKKVNEMMKEENLKIEYYTPDSVKEEMLNG